MKKRWFSTTVWSVLVWLSLGGLYAFGVEPLRPVGAQGPSGRSDNLLQPVLVIQPREIDLGSLGPGEEASRVFHLKNLGAGVTDWNIEPPEGWSLTDNATISGVLYDKPEPIRIQMAFLNEIGPGRQSKGTLLMSMEGGGQTAVYRREVPLGVFRETIRFNSRTGTRMVFVMVRLTELASTSMLSVEPFRIDFGAVRPGETVTRRIHVRNRGREILKWKAGLAGSRGMPPRAPVQEGRYVSFRNEAVAGTGSYSATGPLKEGLELSGSWSEEQGYPAGQGESNALRYRFTGTGIGLFIWKSPEGGPLSVFLDEQFVNHVDGYSEHKEWQEIRIAEGQPEGSHLLTIVNGMGRVVIEGVRVLSKPLLRGPRGWVSLFPDSGMTTRETDYVNIALNARQLTPGLYGDHVYFTSNGGEADIEVFLEVTADSAPSLIAIYRYQSASDYLLTSNPQAEASRLQAKGFTGQGVAFRLFAPGTPGTREFYRWFNPLKGDHFYSYDPQGAGKLPGYHLEGSIGNIATSRLAGTRELYRWVHSASGLHFYTLDPSGEGITKKGYHFDGIAGYVR